MRRWGVAITVRPALRADAESVERTVSERWFSPTIVSSGRRIDIRGLPALIAEDAGAIVGLATYELRGGECEIVTFDSLAEGRGVGTALFDAVVGRGRAAGCRRLPLVTSNDNLEALRFYQRRGMRIVAVPVGAIDRARNVKPMIPDVGLHGIDLHDELELELRLGSPGR